MGGREEVVSTSAFEVFGYMDMLAQKEEVEAKEKQRQLWTQFLIAIYSQPVSDNETPERRQQRQAFIDSIQPKDDSQKKALQWPEEVLQQAQTEGG